MSAVCKITHRDLFLHLRERKLKINISSEVQDELYEFTVSQLKKELASSLQLALKRKICRIVNVLFKKWQSCKSMENRFLDKEASWLDLNFELPDETGKKFFNFYQNYHSALCFSDLIIFIFI